MLSDFACMGIDIVLTNLNHINPYVVGHSVQHRTYCHHAREISFRSEHEDLLEFSPEASLTQLITVGIGI